MTLQTSSTHNNCGRGRGEGRCLWGLTWAPGFPPASLCSMLHRMTVEVRVWWKSRVGHRETRGIQGGLKHTVQRRGRGVFSHPCTLTLQR